MHHSQQIQYKATGAFSKIITDYLDAGENLKPFYTHPVSLAGVEAAIAARQNSLIDRPALVAALTAQYQHLKLEALQQQHLNALLQPNTYTVTTAHQPNIFTGPLYVIYKILHTIKLANSLAQQWPSLHFVPVFYMGAEDADIDELGHIFLEGEKLEWQTTQTGAVGRMTTAGLEPLIERLKNEFGHLAFGAEMAQLITQAYTTQPNVQLATLHLVHALFAQFGLLVVIPHNAALKVLFAAVVQKELIEGFSSRAVERTNAQLEQHYKVQASGRAVNLFYLNDEGRRERIEKNDFGFSVPTLNLQFSEHEVMAELQQHPERFSANVILRGLFQETILPNLIFIGGGGEVAYWLQLKQVFEAAKVPYPMLVLRNSFLLMTPAQQLLQHKCGLETHQLFWPLAQLETWWVQQHAGISLNTAQQQAQLNDLYAAISGLAAAVDPTLRAHTLALQTKASKGLQQLDKKLLRAEKRKRADVLRQLQQLKTSLFPQNNLQERVDNFMPLYARYGPKLIQYLYDSSLSLEQAFVVLHLPEAF